MSNLQAFNFGMNEVRTFTKENEIWFVAKDVCNVLELSNSRIALKRLDEDEISSTYITDALGRKQDTTIINEAGLYTLVLGSRKSEAKAFKRWVTHEVIPAIRKTGSYIIPKTNSEMLLMYTQQLLELERKQVEYDTKLKALESFVKNNVTDKKRYQSSLTVTEIAERLEIIDDIDGIPDAKLMNKIILLLGIQERVKGRWYATDAYENFAVRHVEYEHTKWSEEIIPLIREKIQENPMVVWKASNLKTLEKDMRI